MKKLAGRQDSAVSQVLCERPIREELLGIGRGLIEELVECAAEFFHIVDLSTKKMDTRVTQEELITHAVLCKGNVVRRQGSVEAPVGARPLPSVSEGMPGRVKARSSNMEAAPIRDEAIDLREQSS